MTPGDEFLTVAEVAALLKVPARRLQTIYRLIRRVPSYPIPGVGLRFRRSDIQALIDGCRRDPAAPKVEALGTTRADPADDEDFEVVPGMTRRQLREQARR